MRVAGPQEVGVQRVDAPGRARPCGPRRPGPGRPPGRRTPAGAPRRADAPEDVDLDRLEVEQLHERVDGVLRHGAHPRVRPVGYGPAPCRRRPFPTASAGAPPPPPTRSRAATGTTTGGAWEHTPGSGCKESSGDCCDSWNRWPEDVALLAGARLHRLPVLDRVEPHRARADGEFSTVALDHYRAAVRGPARGAASTRSSRSTTSPRRCGWPTRAVGRADAIADRFAALLRAGRRPPRRR